jgi:uncharacterized protein
MNIINFFKRKETCSPELSEFDITPIKDFAIDGWTLGETHGISHWQRVERNGILLSMDNGHLRNGVKINVVRAFAYLHDKCRIDDWEDLEHGPRAAEMIPSIRETILKGLTDEEITLLEKACRYHTLAHKTGDITVDICFDADRLDLGRVGVTPNPKLMATEQGHFYAANVAEFNKRAIEISKL